jgi:hypothetical protein
MRHIIPYKKPHLSYSTPITIEPFTIIEIIFIDQQCFCQERFVPFLFFACH